MMKTNLSILWSILWRAFVWFPVMATLMIVSSAGLIFSIFLPFLVVFSWMVCADICRFLSLTPGTLVVVWIACLGAAWWLRQFSIFKAHLGYSRL